MTRMGPSRFAGLFGQAPWFAGVSETLQGVLVVYVTRPLEPSEDESLRRALPLVRLRYVDLSG